MELVTAEQREVLFQTFKREAVHLEMRDHYSTSDLERERFAAWKADEPDDLVWVEPWCEEIRAAIAEGKSYRRACLVSEPVSDYQRFAYRAKSPSVDAGEDIRWAPRRLLSAVALPGNDFWMFDEDAVVFNVFSGADDVVERQLYTDPAVVKLCRDAFETVWALAIPHSEYRPV